MSVNTSSQEVMKTREQIREERQDNNSQEKSSSRFGRVRMFPIWLRLILIIVLTAVSITAGAVIGYSVIGDGKAGDTFKKSTWTHIIDLVEKE
ncbi:MULTISPECIES: DNA-directed RNA polymerase subunit beta [Bacillaceae]|uniref:DNA-directed RNA polymerase subunit beta n=1 Tax=Bacillaceae TaxID=186817 RepID=UPI001E5DC714|nr:MULTISPECIES: DNA-directed RNA polymerase subunit beta [Bacillaceae]MCE4049673.1 DNA-directed RNA polymerase subunit beta [Bacillus sp. Au-Bac7]MCM3031843.1 DNA-directed RNA polymerase subunit beta [Niallia sp. MER 6]MDL0436954.1 DNA-directed RNA polymerase subunit beta [Niallia sp. SS-2023]UPO87443.1 DNA-directed RNA polymerase subunit beta [Niallia sp. Man26]